MRLLAHLEVFLAPEEFHIVAAIHIALRVQLTSQTLGTTKEHAGFARRVDLANALEDSIPIGSAKVGGCTEACDGIAIGGGSCSAIVNRVEHNVCCVVRLDACSEVGMNFNAAAEILSLDGKQQALEPFKTAKVSTDPKKVDLPKPALVVLFASSGRTHTMPDALEDTSKRCDTDTGAHEDCCLKLENVLRGGPERTVDVDTRQDLL